MVRIKNRYLLVNILYPSSLPITTSPKTIPPSPLLTLYSPTTDHLTPKSLLSALRSKIAELFGDYGSGLTSSSLAVKYLSCATSTAIIKVARNAYRLLWAALTCMDRVPVGEGEGKRCVFQVVRVSGTVKKVEGEAVRRARDLVTRVRKEVGEEGRRMLEGMGKGASGQMRVEIEDSDAEMDDDEED